MGDLAHVARVIASHCRVAAQTELQYRSNFWLYLGNSLVTLGISLASLALVFAGIDELGGWTADDLLVVVGVFFVLGSVVNGVVHTSMAKFVADIRHGGFDYRLLKPVDAQLVALGQQPDAWRVIDLAVGLGVATVGIVRGGGLGGPADAAAAVGGAVAMLACAIAIVCAFWALLSCITFWTVQGEGILWALDDMYDHLRWPISIFPPGLRFALSSVFPIGFAVTVPAEALTGRLDLATAGVAVAMAAGFTLVSRRVWHVAVRRYEGASS